MEVVMSMMFLFIIMGATHGKVPAAFAPLAIGLGLVMIHLVSIPVTNTSVNPARSTGPALFVGGWALAQLWLFWVAPLIGGALGGAIYRWLSDEPGGTVGGGGPPECWRRLFFRRRHLGHMPHFAARPRRTLAVEVDGRARDGQPLLVAIDIVADQIGHGARPMAHRLAERPAGDGADVLLELRDRRAVERPVPGIVHPRGNLVDQQRRPVGAWDHEHLDREHADVIQPAGDPLRDAARLFRQRLRDRRRSARDFQDMVAVLVFGDVEAFDM